MRPSTHCFLLIGLLMTLCAAQTLSATDTPMQDLIHAMPYGCAPVDFVLEVNGEPIDLEPNENDHYSEETVIMPDGSTAKIQRRVRSHTVRSRTNGGATVRSRSLTITSDSNFIDPLSGEPNMELIIHSTLDQINAINQELRNRQSGMNISAFATAKPPLFKHNRAIVARQNRYGVVDTAFHDIVAPNYDHIVLTAKTIFAMRNGTIHFFNLAGNDLNISKNALAVEVFDNGAYMILSPHSTRGKRFYTPDHTDLLGCDIYCARSYGKSVFIREDGSRGYCMYDFNGKRLNECTFEEVYDGINQEPSPDMIPVKCGGQWGYIRDNGQWVIEPSEAIELLPPRIADFTTLIFYPS